MNNTVCSWHYKEEHNGNWKDCKQCPNDFETEVYVGMAVTKSDNFEILKNPPQFERTHCYACGTMLDLNGSAYSQTITRELKEPI